MNKIWIITLFPSSFDSYLDIGVLGKIFTGERGHSLELKMVSLSEYSEKGFKGVDSHPYGGGAGMLLRADILEKAFLEGIVEAGNYGTDYKNKLEVIFPSPRGKNWDNKGAQNLFSENRERDLVFICGRYEGIDERFIEKYVDHEISIGDYILTGGELAVQVILDSGLRFLSGVLGNEDSHKDDSFGDGLLEHPHYTRPREFDGMVVPEILTSGNHKLIEEFREKEKLRITKKFRPDLLGKKK